MKKQLFLILMIIVISSTLHSQNFINIPAQATESEILKAALCVHPSERQVAWQELEYYAFFHFGTNTFLDKEWGDGTADPKVFNPTEFDANQWAKTVKAAGMKGLILTAKHHDGFCLWPTLTTSYSVSSSDWRGGKGDLVNEVAEACKKEGLKLGIYLSPWDRNHPSYGDSPAYNKVFLAQLTELLTNYGEVFEVWFDGACGEGPNGKVQNYDWESIYALVRKLQPRAVMAVMGPDVRWCGNEAGVGRESEWSVLPVGAASQKTIAANSQQAEGNGTFIPKNATNKDLGSRLQLKDATTLVWYPSEVNTSIRPGWFYHANQDNRVKSVDKLEQIYYNSIGMNASFLLNIPPDRRGLIHENDIKNLMLFKARIDATFKTNLAKTARINAQPSNVKSNIKALTDGNNKSYWTPINSKKDATIEFHFDAPQTIDRLLIQENFRNGQRVESFVLECRDKNGWIEIAKGTTIGYKRILCFEPIHTQLLRVRFTGVRYLPQIAEVGLYCSPTK